MRILFICTGNINRSPAAETISRKLNPKNEYKSASLSSHCNGKITTKKTRDILKQKGYNYTEIRSTLITQELVNWADKIFYAQPSHLKKLQEMFGCLEKFKPLYEYGGLSKITDPAFNGMYEKMIEELEISINKLYAT